MRAGMLVVRFGKARAIPDIRSYRMNFVRSAFFASALTFSRT